MVSTGGAYIAIVYSENSCKGDVCLCVFDHEITVQIRINEYSVMSCIPYIMYIHICALS